MTFRPISDTTNTGRIGNKVFVKYCIVKMIMSLTTANETMRIVTYTNKNKLAPA